MKKDLIVRLFIIRKPTAGRNKKWLVNEETRFNGKRSTVKYSSPILDQINQDFLSKTISHQEAEDKIKEMIEDLKKTEIKLPINIKHHDPVFVKWRTWMEGKKLRDSASVETLKHIFNRMYRILKSTNKTVSSISAVELKEAIQREAVKTSQQKQLASYFNSCFKYIKRDLYLDKKFFKGEDFVFEYVTEAELNILLNKAPPEIKHSARILFFTGIRLGELYGLRRDDWRGNVLWIDRQVRADHKIKSPKNNKERTTVAPKMVQEDLEWWFSSTRKEKYERGSFTQLFPKYCKRVGFKKLRVHDLRHSFAMFCLQEKKVGITIIAKLIGDTVSSCEKHYLGTRLSSETVEDIAGIL